MGKGVAIAPKERAIKLRTGWQPTPAADSAISDALDLLRKGVLPPPDAAVHSVHMDKGLKLVSLGAFNGKGKGFVLDKNAFWPRLYPMGYSVLRRFSTWSGGDVEAWFKLSVEESQRSSTGVIYAMEGCGETIRSEVPQMVLAAAEGKLWQYGRQRSAEHVFRSVHHFFGIENTLIEGLVRAMPDYDKAAAAGLASHRKSLTLPRLRQSAKRPIYGGAVSPGPTADTAGTSVTTSVPQPKRQRVFSLPPEMRIAHAKPCELAEMAAEMAAAAAASAAPVAVCVEAADDGQGGAYM